MTSKILIVDDESIIRRTIKRLLNGIDVDVYEASNGVDALACVKANPDIKVIISDERMPQMGGAELFDHLVAEHNEIKRILITGFTELETIRSTINDGSIYRLILKPWDNEELLLSVVQAIKDYDLVDENKKLQNKILTINQELEKNVDQKNRVLKVNIKSLEMSRKILDELPVAIYCINDEGIIIESNEISKSVLGRTGAIEGLDYHDVFSSTMIDCLENNNNNNNNSDVILNDQTWHPLISNLNSGEGRVLILTRQLINTI
ncbi:MAG: response regulator [Saccharospirillaceae bacterium]|nr:response regulator [Pseudomonadales bacterium]NRB78941.1 response regulator [Saccharospirillaceae bacterium]